MAGWLTRATSAFGRRKPPPPQPFDFPCDCGERITGWRTAAHQKLNCTLCDRQLLVLPADVYPAVKRSAPVEPIKAPPAVVQPEEKPGKKKSSSTAEKKSGKAAQREKETETAAPATAATEERVRLSPMLQQGRARRRTLRLVVVCMLALVGVTGWSLRNRTLREQARAAIPDATENGLAALRSGEFSKAVQQLDVAVAALDTLRRDDAAAMAIRQAHREAVAANGLSSLGIAGLGDEFFSWSGTVEERQDHMRTEYGSQWLIFDVDLARRVQDGQSIPQLDVPYVLRNGRSVLVECEFPELRRLLEAHQDETPPRAIFAAKLDQWRDSPGQAPIVVRIEPKTAFLWSDYDSYCAAGFEPASEEEMAATKSLLARQRQQEVKP